MKADWNQRIDFDPDFWMSGWTESQEEWHFSGRRDFQSLISGIELSEAATWNTLEYGCGTGRLTSHAGQCLGRIDAVDISERAVDVARQRLKAHCNIHVECCDGVTLPERATLSYDLVYSWAVISHVDYAVCVSLIAEMVRVLRVGGQLRLQLYVGNSADSPPAADTLSIRGYDTAILCEVLQLLGCDAPTVRDCGLPFDGSLYNALHPVIVETRRQDCRLVAGIDHICDLVRGRRPESTASSLERSMLYDRLTRLIKRGDFVAARNTASFLLQKESRPDRLGDLNDAIELLSVMQ